MRTNIKYNKNLFVYFIIVFSLFEIVVQGAEQRPMISAAERALAILEVQNTFSKHQYYHGPGKNLKEINEIWVNEDGEYGKTATWSNSRGIWEGIKLIKEFYGTASIETQKKSLENLSKTYPEIKNVKENLNIGSLDIHTQTTPVIEIAGDGKTAKGIWYSIGIGVFFTDKKDREGNAIADGTWYFEKYGVDFAKEDGKWKIWHLQTYYDFAPPLGTDWTRPLEKQQLSPKADVQKELLKPVSKDSNLPDPTKPNTTAYKTWSPTTVPVIEPRIPEPYDTFSETFSY